MPEDYWRLWATKHDSSSALARVDEACSKFLADKKSWTVVANRWDNIDRLLSGPVPDGIWANIHLLLVLETYQLRFTHAIWRDKDAGLKDGIREVVRLWSTSDDGYGDTYVDVKAAHKELIREHLDKAWEGLAYLQNVSKFRESTIRLHV